MSEMRIYVAFLLGAVLIAVFGSYGCGRLVSDDSQALRAAVGSGLANARVTGHTYWLVPLAGCGRDDSVKIGIAGVNARGDVVHAFVCEGPFKGATVRY